MSDLIELEDLVPAIKSPYKVTKSILGTTTKVMSDKFVCSPRELNILFDKFREKIGYFKPTKIGFQYLISFTDKTHYENTDLTLLESNLASSGKSTDKIILNWIVVHDHDGNENELSITVRISNPINPFVMLQAILSQTPDDIDSLEMETGSVSVSVNGATQTASEEIFELVGRWVDSCPQPQSITKINTLINQHKSKIEAINTWILPIFYSIACFLFLRQLQSQDAIAYAFIMLCGFIVIRSITGKFNEMIYRWCRMSHLFSLFMLTGGDQNQQTKFLADATNSTVKLVASVLASFMVNVAAGFFVAETLIS
ncbi:hypothetical protein ACJJIC_02180 [Microbulbifer sp. ANSA002]|uniref:hypothetical protein n=1 Tax=unclassified Microbulbifer TaxID=2619833 RepID=UPI0040417FD2